MKKKTQQRIEDAAEKRQEAKESARWFAGEITTLLQRMTRGINNEDVVSDEQAQARLDVIANVYKDLVTCDQLPDGFNSEIV